MATELPLPPPKLASYVIGGFDVEDPVAAYLDQGAAIRDALVRLLGREFSFVGKRVLDFGCGAGRVLRQLVGSGAELHGCDIDEASIAWLEAHLSPPLHVVRSGERPPLPYPDAHFDLAYAMSVFSHLTDTWSEWLLELRRITAPSGTVVVTVMGAPFSEQIAGEPWDPNRIGMNVLGYGRPWSAGGPMVLHSEWWIRAHWGRAFEIMDYRPAAVEGQDAVVLRPRPEPLDPQALERPEPGEPRELEAARHAIRQLHREHANLNRAHDAYAAAYAEEARRRAELEARLAALQQAPARAPRRSLLARASRLFARRARDLGSRH